MPEKEVDNDQPLEVIEVDTNVAILMLLMVLLQLIYHVNDNYCSC